MVVGMATRTVMATAMAMMIATAFVMCGDSNGNSYGNSYGNGYGNGNGNGEALFVGSGCVVVHNLVAHSCCTQHCRDACLCIKVLTMPLLLVSSFSSHQKCKTR